MADFSYALSQRELIQDAAVVEEFDRLIARLNGFLKGIGQSNAEADLETGIVQDPGLIVTTQATLLQLKSVTDVITANVNDYEGGSAGALETASILLLTANAGGTFNITGVKASQPGRVLLFCNIDTTGTLVLVHQSTSSAAPNRFRNAVGANITLSFGECVWAVYDGGISRWRAITGA